MKWPVLVCALLLCELSANARTSPPSTAARPPPPPATPAHLPSSAAAPAKMHKYKKGGKKLRNVGVTPEVHAHTTPEPEEEDEKPDFEDKHGHTEDPVVEMENGHGKEADTDSDLHPHRVTEAAKLRGPHDKKDKSQEAPVEPAVTESQSTPKYKLIYFDARGICESIRLLFRYANESFVDERISKKKWLAIKDTTFYGKIPILEVDGKPLAQCYAISRYLARQFDLAGKDDWEAAKLDEAADFHKYVLTELSPYLFVLSGYRSGDKDLLRKELFVPVVDKNFPIYANLLKHANSGFFARSGVSWVDFVVSEYLTTIRHYEPQILQKYPMLSKFIDRVQGLPQIKDYIEKRTHTPLQLML